MRTTIVDAVRANPGDKAALRVYADALMERDDPQGEAIQLSLDLEDMALFDPKRVTLEHRLDDLVAQHEFGWAAAVDPASPQARWPTSQVQLYRGMPASLSGGVPYLVEHLDRIAAHTPIASLRLSFTADLPRLFETQTFAKLSHLQLTAMDRGDEVTEALFGGIDFPVLDELEIRRLTERSVRAVSRCAALTKLRSLTLDAPAVPIEALTPLLESAGGSLERLRLDGIVVGANGLATIAKHCKRLRTLVLEHAGLDAKAAKQLAEEVAFAKLEELGVGGNPLKAAGITALAASKVLANVVRVSFKRIGNDPPFGAKLLGAFVDALVWKKLASIDLDSCNIREEGAWRLAELPKLQELALEHNALGDKGITALAKAKTLRALRILRLDGNSITREGMAQLARAPWLATIEELSLRQNKFVGAGGEALAGGELGSLRVLHLGHNWLSATGIRSILEAAPELRVIYNGMNNFTEAEYVTVLLEAEHPPPLRRLNLAALPEEQLDQLVGSPRIAGVRWLKLVSDDFDDDHAERLAANHAASLGWLDVTAPGLGERGRAALTKRFGSRVWIA